MSLTSHSFTPRRRQVVLSLAALGSLGPGGLLAQPVMGTSTKPIRLVVPYAAGGPIDVTARWLAERVRDTLGTVVIDNRPGAGGNLGVDLVAKAAPDGHTIGISAVATHAINPWLFSKMPFDAARDFAPITQILRVPNVLVINTQTAERLDIRSFQDLITYARAHPGQLNYGSGGNGTPSHLQGATLQALTGTETVHVPFKNAGDVIPSLIRGDLHFAFQVMSFGAPFVRSGKLRLLATTGAVRARQFPDAPTLHETIRNDLAIQENWLGVAFPAKTPAAIVKRFHAEILRALPDPVVQKGMESSGTNASPSESPEEYTAYVRRENDKWREIVKLSGVKVE